MTAGSSRTGRMRLDVLMVERGLAATRSQAQLLIREGHVRVDGERCMQPGEQIAEGRRIEVEQAPRFVSRGGEKLEAALVEFGIEVQGVVCADVGASTGGFTDCLLQRGAAKVYAIDVGKGILDWRLRSDSRVVVMEETNARYLDRLPEAMDLVTVDASFISLRLLLPVLRAWLAPQGQAVALIKPQFEAGRAQVKRGGVVRDAAVHQSVLVEVLTAASHTGLWPHGLVRSPLRGPAGNVEFLAWLRQEAAPHSIEQIVTLLGLDRIQA
jgi:23S rRNA (cytidine1920-2'-O)/16S rRNA (cytidine1409-2'-O)-methyltransferase